MGFGRWVRWATLTVAVGAFVAVLPIAVAQPWAALALLAVPLALRPSRAMLTAEDAPALIAALVGTVRLELVAGALIIKFWFPDANTTLWAMGFFCVLLGLNWMTVKAYAEAEYWFAGIKVVTVLIFLLVGLLLVFGALGGEAVGSDHLTQRRQAVGTARGGRRRHDGRCEHSVRAPVRGSEQ